MKVKLQCRFLLLPTVLLGALLTAACTDNDKKVITTQNNNLSSNSSPEHIPNTNDSKSSTNENQVDSNSNTDVQQMNTMGEDSHSGSSGGMGDAHTESAPNKSGTEEHMDKKGSNKSVGPTTGSQNMRTTRGEKAPKVQSDTPTHDSGDSTSTQTEQSENGIEHTGSPAPGTKVEIPSEKLPTKAQEAKPMPEEGN